MKKENGWSDENEALVIGVLAELLQAERHRVKGLRVLKKAYKEKTDQLTKLLLASASPPDPIELMSILRWEDAATTDTDLRAVMEEEDQT